MHDINSLQAMYSYAVKSLQHKLNFVSSSWWVNSKKQTSKSLEMRANLCTIHKSKGMIEAG